MTKCENRQEGQYRCIKVRFNRRCKSCSFGCRVAEELAQRRRLHSIDSKIVFLANSSNLLGSPKESGEQGLEADAGEHIELGEAREGAEEPQYYQTERKTERSTA